MLRKHAFAFSTWGPLTPLFAPPDGAGDGGTPATGGSDAPAGDGSAGSDSPSGDDRPQDGDGDDAVDRSAGGSDDRSGDDPDDDELAELDSLPPDAQLKNARTRLRRYQRQFRTLRPIADLFRSEDGRYLAPQEVQRRLNAAADWDEMHPFLQQHPDIVAQILERKNRGTGPVADQRPQFEDPFKDEDKLPFDTSTEAGRFIVDNLRGMAKQNFELRQQIEELRTGVTEVKQNEGRRSLASVENTWKSRTLEAATKAGLDEADKRLFVESVWNVFERGKLTRSLARLNLQQVIDQKLAPFKGRRRATVAGQQGRAERGRIVPPPAGRGRTTAAAATDRNNAGTIKDARKSLFSRLGMSAPPR